MLIIERKNLLFFDLLLHVEPIEYLILFYFILFLELNYTGETQPYRIINKKYKYNSFV